jgi:D-glycero-D-manno-heptose 1,7-bisphosphate phosphatase
MIRSSARIAFLDRDGVINHDPGYLGEPENFILINGVREALRLLRDTGHLLVVVTNQSGIGRGFYSEEDYARVTEKMRNLLAQDDISLAAVLHCPHLETDHCNCRKPAPGMLISGAALTGGSLADAVMFGDKPSDIAAGRRAGVHACFLVGTVETAMCDVADGYGQDLLSCVQLYLKTAH